MNSLSYELSNDDMVRVIKRYDPTFREDDIIEYPNLIRMNIDLLLPNENDYKVIYFISGETYSGKMGHWCALARKQGKVLWFDPYHLTADAEEKWLSKRDRIKFREDKPILHEIVPKNELISNPYQFQSSKPNVNTCGRWTCEFCIYCCIQGHSIEEFHNFIEHIKRNTGQSYDQIVVNLIRL
jgi:hypothetical protein